MQTNNIESTDDLLKQYDKVSRQYKAALLELDDFKAKINEIVNKLAEQGITMAYID